MLYKLPLELWPKGMPDAALLENCPPILYPLKIGAMYGLGNSCESGCLVKPKDS